MAEWIECINNSRDLHLQMTEDELEKNISSTEDLQDLNWMKIFNSKIELSRSFIVKYIDRIEWSWLMKPIHEAILDRYYRRVVQWNAQLYGQPRTFEFLIRHKKRFNWDSLFANPPSWFNELHYLEFQHMYYHGKKPVFICMNSVEASSSIDIVPIVWCKRDIEVES